MALAAVSTIALSSCGDAGPLTSHVGRGVTSKSGKTANGKDSAVSRAAISGPLDPSFFAAGSCVAFPPTSGNLHKTVFLDAGHGGVDPGAVGTTQSGTPVYEKNLTLPVEMDATALLRAKGYRVVVSRTNGGPVVAPKPGAIVAGLFTDTGLHDEVVGRDICANLAEADALVGIYFDAGGSPTNAGCVTGYDAVRTFSSSNLRLAQQVQSSVLSAMNDHGWQIPDVGVLTDGSLGSSASSAGLSYGHLVLLGPAKNGYLTTPSQMPGAVVEPLFITDPAEASIADSSIGQHAIAGGIAKAVAEFLG